MRQDEQRRSQPRTVADLCHAIEERRIPVTRERDEYVVRQRDLRRWLDGAPRRRLARMPQRPAS